MSVKSVHRGYFLPQDISVAGGEAQFSVDLWPEWYHNTVEETRVQMEEWGKRRLDGIEFIPMVFQKADVPRVAEIARVARGYGVDLWVTPRLFKTFNIFPIVPDRFAGKHLARDGHIVTALKNWSMRPDLDYFNREAVDWAFAIFKEDFLDACGGNAFQGYIWPEEAHGHSQYGRIVEKGLIPYWQRPSYSDNSLELWRHYCKANDVRFEGRLVDRFPVAEEGMVANGKGKTAFYPGLQALPDIVRADVPVSRWPRNAGVWEAWDRFRSRAYMENFLLPWSRMVNDANGSNPDWRGVEYFGSTPWLLPYEKVGNPEWLWKTGAWGYQGGIDLELMGRSPEVTYINHEFRGRVREARLEERHDFFLSLIDDRARDVHGVLLHGEFGDKSQAPLEEEEEKARWRFIAKYRPRVISMWSIAMLHPKMPGYDAAKTERFWTRLCAYRETGDPFAGD